MTEFIKVRGAREHNLKDISVDIPTRQLVVVTGLSGSGKSSLMFGTVYAEGQRRYVESLSAYARQFLKTEKKPEVDKIEGLMPSIAVDQKTVSKNPRSTVGTVTEVYDYMRLLFARIGVPTSPTTGLPITKQSATDIVDILCSQHVGRYCKILFTLCRERKGEFVEEINEAKRLGFYDFLVNGTEYTADAIPPLVKSNKHTIWVVADELTVSVEERERVAIAVENALRFGKESLVGLLVEDQDEVLLFSTKFSCPESGFSLPALEPRMFSFNSSFGACERCLGLGVTQDVDLMKVVVDPKKSIATGAIFLSAYKDWADFLSEVCKTLGLDAYKALELWSEEEKGRFFDGCTLDSSNDFLALEAFKIVKNDYYIGLKEWIYKSWESASLRRKNFWAAMMGMMNCSKCQGARLNYKALLVRINGKNIHELCSLPISELETWIQNIELSEQETGIAGLVLAEVNKRLKFLTTIGLGYLNLAREARTLSGGESQRIRLAAHLGSALTNVLYVLDEPSIGLHPRDTDRLLGSLQTLKSLPNTIVVVEHDVAFMEAADHIIDIGPLAGVHGGEVVAQGSFEEIKQAKSLTGEFLRGERKIEIPNRRVVDKTTDSITVIGAKKNNLKNVDVQIPLGRFVGVSGVSGGGKSSLIKETLFSDGIAMLNKEHLKNCKDIQGLEVVTQMTLVSQEPIGRTPRSNPATYCGFFTEIRNIFAQTPEGKRRGYTSGRFSFNVPGGRCEFCEGAGTVLVSMSFLPDVNVVCERCNGQRFNTETLQIRWKGNTIADVLQLPVEEAIELFDGYRSIKRSLDCLQRVGLGYIKLGQSATTLSGGEAQRIKLAKELSRPKGMGRVYILDEPTTGLHIYDTFLLIQILQSLVDQGNTVIVIEHNLEVLKTVDWLIDLGPEGGSKGGLVVASGTPEVVSETEGSPTGSFLRGLVSGA